jgi:glycosyltransferase involved in cell wall biosynthesis
VIVEGKHGLLVPIEDADALADAIMQLMANPQLHHEMGAAAKEQVLGLYTTSHMCEQYLTLMLKQM